MEVLVFIKIILVIKVSFDLVEKKKILEEAKFSNRYCVEFYKQDPEILASSSEFSFVTNSRENPFSR